MGLLFAKSGRKIGKSSSPNNIPFVFLRMQANTQRNTYCNIYFMFITIPCKDREPHPRQMDYGHTDIGLNCPEWTTDIQILALIAQPDYGHTDNGLNNLKLTSNI